SSRLLRADWPPEPEAPLEEDEEEACCESWLDEDWFRIICWICCCNCSASRRSISCSQRCRKASCCCRCAASSCCRSASAFNRSIACCNSCAFLLGEAACCPVSYWFLLVSNSRSSMLARSRPAPPPNPPFWLPNAI